SCMQLSVNTRKTNTHSAANMNDDIRSSSVKDFFFSSRRRHTRFSRDWSSDVCSSDLILFCNTHNIRSFRINSQLFPLYTHPICGYSFDDLPNAADLNTQLQTIYATAKKHNIRLRSEERRVGKEYISCLKREPINTHLE